MNQALCTRCNGTGGADGKHIPIRWIVCGACNGATVTPIVQDELKLRITAGETAFELAAEFGIRPTHVMLATNVWAA